MVKDVSASYDALVNLFESICSFLQRLDIYTKIHLTRSMGEILVKIMVQLISTLAVATKQIKQGRLSESILTNKSLYLTGPGKFGKKLLGDHDVEAVLHRLDKLTVDEARMVAAQTLEVMYRLVENLRNVMSGERVQHYLLCPLC